MKKVSLAVFTLMVVLTAGAWVYAQEAEPTASPEAANEQSIQEKNKRLARQFYEQVWFSRNTDAALELVAPEYVVHDIGDRKGVTEPAVEQKNIADFFWSNGDMSASSIDYQIAEGDLVATRWQWRFKSESILFTLLGGSEVQNPIINVFRFKDGKIVEIWNHRHDIDNVNGSFNTIRGFAIGFVPTAAVAIVFFFLWRRGRRKLKRLSEAAST